MKCSKVYPTGGVKSIWQRLLRCGERFGRIVPAADFPAVGVEQLGHFLDHKSAICEELHIWVVVSERWAVEFLEIQLRWAGAGRYEIAFGQVHLRQTVVPMKKAAKARLTVEGYALRNSLNGTRSQVRVRAVLLTSSKIDGSTGSKYRLLARGMQPW